MKVQRLHIALLASVAFSLSACGGGGAHVSSTPFVPDPTPTPAPTPTPTPCSGADCLEPIKIFPDVTASTTFAALGLEAAGPNVSLDSLERNGFSVSYDAAAGVYVIGLPSLKPGAFYVDKTNTPNDTLWSGIIQSDIQGGARISVFKPRPTNPVIQLTYTSYAQYPALGGTGGFGFVVFGTPTDQTNIPVTGSAAYNAAVRGSGSDPNYFIQGSATLQFDFAAGTLAGHFDPTISSVFGIGEQSSLGRYDFVNTIFGAGSTTYSGQLSQSGLPGTGAFDGLFTGPNAQELMARWTAPYANPFTHQNSTMFGVWVGKKGP